MTLTLELVRDMMVLNVLNVPNFRSVGPTVRPAERKQTHGRTDATKNITSSANAGGKNLTDIF